MKEYIIRAPYFTGFYGYELFTELDDMSGFEYNHPELYNELCERGLIRDFTEKIYDLIDWSKTYENISKQLVDNVYWGIFSDRVEGVDYHSLHSPKYYNYSTDEIYMKMSITDDQLYDIEMFCFGEMKGAFEGYLKYKYTSCSGFISFIPNNLPEFKEEYREYKRTEDENFETYLGILFEFIFTQESRFEENVSPYDSDSMWEALEYSETFDEEEIAKELLLEAVEETI